MPASLDLTAAVPLCGALLGRLEAGVLELDGSGVERVSTPCLQVLAAAAASAREKGVAFLLRGASAPLSEAILDLGLVAAIPIEG